MPPSSLGSGESEEILVLVLGAVAVIARHARGATGRRGATPSCSAFTANVLRTGQAGQPGLLAHAEPSQSSAKDAEPRLHVARGRHRCGWRTHGGPGLVAVHRLYRSSYGGKLLLQH